MKKKLVFVFSLFLHEYLKRFKVSFFKKKGFDLYIINLNHIIHPHYKNNDIFFNKKKGFKYFYVKKLSDWYFLKKKFDYKNTFFWCHFHPVNIISFKIALDISKFKFFRTYNDGYTVNYKKKNLLVFKTFLSLVI